MNNTFLNLFASVPMCRALNETGLTDNIAFKYVLYKDGPTHIISKAFDPLGLYSLDLSEVGVTQSPAEKIPAYTLGDLLSILPDWVIAKTNNTYEISIDKFYEQTPCRNHVRYVDAVGEAVLELLKSKKLDRFACNTQLSLNHNS